MSVELERCLTGRKLVQIEVDGVLIGKEVAAAEFDFTTATESLRNENYKWATVQSYYSMFHTAKALVLSRGYREKGHYCLFVALRELFGEKNLLEVKHINDYEETMGARKDADYGLIYSRDSAGEAIGNAGSFLKKAKEILHKGGISWEKPLQ